ncbi:gliding motility-associated C-terminal domain-containing protein [Hymenobacter sp. GOD-10R]|uniref:T9SS type B sorting domain-containing protein n=1 Tax=Hymenobacter sp. GOD-10R TaxID=3093922 RepID=UPI002D774536|nr:gliding motility-associated C-terminal domain-containing protein [Hymenobacter sp. GOD-10R]WRQ26587.1 gliding motility-associated C-terminal domain-containing protein [Hymenobacter sp. GOD-10R]
MPATLPCHTLSSTRTSSSQLFEPDQPVGIGNRRPIKPTLRAASWLLTLLLLLLSGAATTILAQTAPAPPPECSQDEKFANTWYFGYKAGLDFNRATDSIPPTVLTNSGMDAPAGAGVMSDGTGKILFYSNGERVWNGDGSPMTDGMGLAGNANNTDGPLPIRVPGIVAPGQPTRYLLFTLNSTVGLSYSEIEIPAGGGPGRVILATKNTPLARGTAEKISGVFHKNGCDIWVIVHGWGNSTAGNDNRGDAFLAYRVRTTGVDTAPVISPVGSLHAPNISPVGYKGQMKITPNGQQLALARYSETTGDNSSTVELFSFDTNIGRVSADPSKPFIVDRGEGKYYGVEFVPGSKLYATVMNPPKLLQFDISGTSTGTPPKQNIPLKTSADLGSMQVAPDGKIYVARNDQPALGFIAYPDSLGAAVGYAEDSLQLGTGRSGLGLVNFNQSSLLRVGPSPRLTGCRQITFTAPSINFSGKIYDWDFGDGTKISQSTTDSVVVHTYATPGPYTITLRITTNCFCRESSITIQVPGLPVPGTIAAPQQVCQGTAAVITSTVNASSDAGLPPVYQWLSSPDNTPGSFREIPGATSASYQLPTSLPPGTTYYQRRVQLLLPDLSGPYCDPSFTAVVSVTVTPALAAGSIGANQTVCSGAAAANLTSTAPASGGTGTPAYQWESSTDNVTWTNVPGANGETLAPGTLSVTTSFRRRVTSGACSEVSNTVTITVSPALTSGSIAANQTICAGSAPAALTSVAPAAGGTGLIVYLWQYSIDNSTWNDIGGSGTLEITPGTLTTTTYFRRQASSSSACAPAYSNVITITVTPALTAGTVGADQTLCPGATPASLTSTADASGGTGTFAYLWEFSTDNSTWTAITGATGSTLAPGPLTTTTYFRRRVTSGPCGPVYSPAVTLTVLPALTAGSIAANQTLCAGATPNLLTSTAGPTGGTSTYGYQWELSADNSTWTAISGATNETFAPGPLTATTYFRRQVTSGGCTTTPSNVVVITIAPALTAGTIGADQTLCTGGTPSSLTSSAPAAGGLGTITYQWELSTDNVTWAAIGSANGLTYVPGQLNTTTYFRRRANASSGCAPAYSNVVTIGVVPALTAGVISTNQTLCAGATPAQLTNTTSPTGGTGTYTYQWESSTDNATWTAINGATGADYAPGPLTTTTYFRRRVTSGPCGPVYSPTATLTVLPTLLAGSIAADQTICAGATPSSLSSTNDASGGTGTYVYQWESSPDNSTWTAIGGANNPTFAPSSLTATTYFRRRVTSGTGTCSTAVSNVVAVQVQPLVTPTVSLTPPPVQCAGTALTFTATATNVGTTPAFQWFVNNTAVANGPTFTSSTLVTGDQVRVTVTASVGICSTGPATATVTVTRTPVALPTLAIAVQPGAPVCLGAPLTFSIANVTEPGLTPTYQWQVNGSDVAGATNPVFTSTALREGQIVTLRLRTTDACGQPTTAVSNGIAVRIQPPVDVDAGPDKEVLLGSAVVLDGRADGTYPVTWSPAVGLSFPNNDQLHPSAAPTVTTTYTLSAGAGGCADADQVTVTVRPPIRIPNAFTPNGDGRDDTWQIEFIEQFPNTTVSVFNRWGTRIFSSENYSRANEWRGDINGQPAPVGTYYYVVVTKGPLGKSYSGSITILY